MMKLIKKYLFLTLFFFNLLYVWTLQAEDASRSLGFDDLNIDLNTWLAFYEVHQKSCPKFSRDISSIISDREAALLRVTSKRIVEMYNIRNATKESATLINDDILNEFGSCEKIDLYTYISIDKIVSDLLAQIKSAVQKLPDKSQVKKEAIQNKNNYKNLSNEAVTHLASALIRGTWIDLSNVIEVLVDIEKDVAAGIKIMKYAATNRKSTNASRYLGKYYSSQNATEAVKYYTISGNMKDLRSVEWLATYYACINQPKKYAHYLEQFRKLHSGLAELLHNEVLEFGEPANCLDIK